MRYVIMVFALAGCADKYADCIEQQKQEYRDRNPKASYNQVQNKQFEVELMCSKFKKGMQLEYHAHIYWRNDQERARAISFRNYLEESGCVMGRVWDWPIGPHPLPMYQIVYNLSLIHI